MPQVSDKEVLIKAMVFKTNAGTEYRIQTEQGGSVITLQIGGVVLNMTQADLSEFLKNFTTVDLWRTARMIPRAGMEDIYKP